MTISSGQKNAFYRLIENSIAKIPEWLSLRTTAKGFKNSHLWIIILLMALFSFVYYLDQTPLVNTPLFNHNFFTGVHDIHRVFFLIPIVYASIIFRRKGGLITSFIFLCVVLPRAFIFSPYNDPLLRPLVFVLFSTLTSLLIAISLSQFEREKKTNTALNEAYRELGKAHQSLKESQDQLIQAEKLLSLGQMAASIAHEVNNPLSGVIVYTKLLIKKITSDSISKQTILDYLSKMESELTRSTWLIRNLLDFARQSPPSINDVDLNEVIDRALDLALHSAVLQNIQVIKEVSVSLPKIRADFDQLKQVCTNLILNAIQAMSQGGTLTISTSFNASQVKIEFQDTGCGISPENMCKLFTPFFTTKSVVKGVGLGLAVSYGIIQRHKGRIEVQSKEGEGTTFSIYLPLTGEQNS